MGDFIGLRKGRLGRRLAQLMGATKPEFMTALG